MWPKVLIFLFEYINQEEAAFKIYYEKDFNYGFTWFG